MGTPLDEIFDTFYSLMRDTDLAKLSDDDLEDCGKIDTWYTGDKFAVYKDEKATKATKLCDSQEEADGYIQNKLNGKGIVKYRQGEYRRCQDYCSCCNFCKYYKERKAE